MNASTAYPVQILHEHITGLEGAITACLADPGHKPVHKLRTETRRVEALLVLLGLMPGLPEHRKEGAALLRSLAKLRRAAGTVRDLDVHRKMLDELAEIAPAPLEDVTGEDDLIKTPVTKRKRKLHERDKGPARPAAEDPLAKSESLSLPAAELRKRLGDERDKAAGTLQHVLRKRQVKTARAAETLWEILSPAKDLPLSAGDLLRDAEGLLSREVWQEKNAVSDLDEKELHSFRKAAKKARYLLESLPEDAALAAAARRFEALQEVSGQWHDALQLMRAARRYFGKSHQLTVAYREDRDSKLGTYRAALASLTKPAEPTAKQKPSRAQRPSSGKAKAKAA